MFSNRSLVFKYKMICKGMFIFCSNLKVYLNIFSILFMKFNNMIMEIGNKIKSKNYLRKSKLYYLSHMLNFMVQGIGMRWNMSIPLFINTFYFQKHCPGNELYLLQGE